MSLVCWNIPDWLAPAGAVHEEASNAAHAAATSPAATSIAEQFTGGSTATTTAFIAGMFLGVRLIAEFLSRMAGSLESGEGGESKDEVPGWVWALIGFMARTTAITGMPKAYTKHIERKKQKASPKKAAADDLADTDDVGKLVQVRVNGRTMIGRLTRYSDSLCIVRGYTNNEVITVKPADIYKLN